MPTVVDRDRLLHLLRESFGHRDFRPGQEPVVAHTVSQRDVLVVMPTGAGKSLCFQLPALYLPGLTVVVSPLIALMKDQVDSLQTLGIAATFINSSISIEEREARLEASIRGENRILYVAPERFRNSSFTQRLAEAEIALFVIDEAHCLSQWGHDFRPDYLRLGTVRNRLGRPTTLAATATATDRVRDDIIQTLELDDPAVFVTGFDRSNLQLEVQHPRSRASKDALLQQELAAMGRPALVYCATRRSVERVTQFLQRRGERVAGYHAGLDPEERTRIQNHFMAGHYSIVAATNAFGMGIDKDDVRAVIHDDIPRTVEAYYQEIGRAGRDGKPSRILLLYRPEDRGIQDFFINNSYPPEWAVIATWQALSDEGQPTVFRSRSSLAEALGQGASERMVGSAMVVLEREGWLRRLPVREGLTLVTFTAQGDDGAPKRAGLPRDLWQELTRLRRSGGHPLHGGNSRSAPPRQTDEFWASLGAESRPNPEEGSEPETRGPQNIAVHLPTLCEQLGVPRTRLSGALRRLQELGLLRSESGERCSGAKLLRLDREFDLDFGPLRARRDHELQKLDKMLSYAETEACRRAAILTYFGETPPWESCGNCDVCVGEDRSSTTTPAALTGAAETMARKALSCVARMGNGHSISMVGKVLKGSASKTVRSSSFADLSTFGILRELTQDEISQVLRALIRSGCLVETSVSRSVRGYERSYRVLNLAELGRRVMRQEEPDFTMVFPPVGALRPRHTGTRAARRGLRANEEALTRESMALFEKLREVRAARAEDEGVPPYAMGNNRLLRAIAKSLPESRGAMLELPGCGERMFDKVGHLYLEVVQAFASNSEGS
ncbi:MAG: ATP-dependent DNA helicase RecQ [Myxococcota bacterium]|nr:ATP-dependent DNA helicase RecQ [Myxococcota bacterium]